jgi:hypothetical protein
MKSTLKRALTDEAGAALVLTLVLMLVGGLVVGPLLGFMGSGLLAGSVYERRTDELYAADAGVEDALWKILNQAGGVESLTKCYDELGPYPIQNVNGKSVAVTITYLVSEPVYPTYCYRIEATATGADGSATKITAYVTGDSTSGNYSGILENVITSRFEIEDKGDVYAPVGHGPAPYYEGAWPPADELALWYRHDVESEHATHYYDDLMIDVAGVSQELGPIYVDGQLTIKNTDKHSPATVTLTGTAYATGVTNIFGPTSNEPYQLTLDLNGHTIFVESSANHSENAFAIQNCNIIGPGAIIVVGDIYFAPKAETGVTDPIFIMSVNHKTLLQPGGEFYGAVAGSVEAELKKGGGSLTYPEEEGWYLGLNFPLGVQKRLNYSLASWVVTPT